MSMFLNREFFAGLIEELGIVIGALIDTTVTATPGLPVAGRQWVIEMRADGALSGTVMFALDHQGAAAMTRLMVGLDDAPNEALIDTLREVAAQALSALALKPVSRGATLTAARLSPKDDIAPTGDWAVYSLGAEKLPAPVAVTVWGQLAAVTAEAPSAAAPASTVSAASTNRAEDRIDVILDIDLPLVVRFGRTEVPLRTLARMGPGSVIDLARSPDDPVELLVSNRVVARGEVVIVGGNYGIRILDVVSPRERVRSMEV